MPEPSLPLSIIYNPKSGFHANHQDAIYEEVITLWSKAGFNIQSFAMDHEVDFKPYGTSVKPHQRCHMA